MVERNAQRMAATPLLRPHFVLSRPVLRALCVILIGGILCTTWLTWRIVSRPSEINTHLLHSRIHPIESLMGDARIRFDRQLSSRSTDISSATARYRGRRGRHPPPGFDTWFNAAMKDDAIVVEEYFDRIYKDLTPFWALDPDVIARQAASWHWVVKVRDGVTSSQGNADGRVPWLSLWTALVKEFAEHLPDVSMPINYMDEPRILVPHEKIMAMVAYEGGHRSTANGSDLIITYRSLAELDSHKIEPYDPVWLDVPHKHWALAVKACGPQTPAHGAQPVTDYAGPAVFMQDWQPTFAYRGYIQNWTAAMDPCHQPHLRQLHGSLIEPISLSSTEELIPLFSGSKMPLNNDILIPGAMYLTDDPFYSGGTSQGPAWGAKKTGVVWRGAASGGRTHEHTWHHFQRHRLVDMLNATTVSRAEAEGSRPLTFELPSEKLYGSTLQAQKKLGSWLETSADAGFGFLCPGHECDFVKTHFQIVEEMPMKKQYEFKFLPDADGNSFSARFRGFMRSSSLPLKATIYAEWHDDRLQPWLHFVPLDNTFRDLYPVLEFFGDEDGRGDEAAEQIAMAGQQWSEKVLRRDDMKLYVWRLLLEWARICDPNRDILGFAGPNEA